MAETFDAAGRLSQGLPSVDNVQQYVTACGSVGYSQADLTSHPSQIREWYTTEDGLDLGSLEADSQSLTAAEAAAHEAWTRQAEQTGVLSAAWQGTGAEASRALLRRHGDAAAQTAGALRSAAEAMADLRDRLWRAVDLKVVAAQSIDDRAATQRAEWLAAAETVATGVGDRAAASELIDQQVKPFVDNDIRHDWMTAMREALAAINAAFDAATAELSSLPEVAFDVPGDLGPSWTPPPAVEEASAGPPAPSPPAAAFTAAPMPSAPPTAPAAMPPPPAAMPPPPAAMPPPPAAMPPPAGAMPPPTGGMGGGMGMPDVGGGLSGIGQQLADAFGGLLGSTGDALGDLSGPDDGSEIDEPEDVEDLLGEDGEDEVDEKAKNEEAVEEEEASEEEAEEAGAEVAAEPAEPDCQPPAEPLAEEPPNEPVATPAPVPVPPESPLPPAPPPAPMAAETPCEIAADELPQVGE